MSVRLPPYQTSYQLPGPPTAAGGWSREEAGAPAAWLEPEGVPWGRYFDVLKRHALFILAFAAAGSALGLFAARRVKPVYDAQATVWIGAGNNQQSGPIRAQQLLPQTSWVELLRSFAILDPVVHLLNLNLGYDQPADSVLFRNFTSGVAPRPGEYVLRLDPSRRNYALSLPNGRTVERGAVGDTIGRTLGFAWMPDVRFLSPNRAISFSVTSPRAASIGLLQHVNALLPEDGQFLRLTLSGSDPVRTARTVNAWAEQFVLSAGELKKRHLLDFKEILRGQVTTAERELHRSEIQLEQFRVNTITLPSATAPVAGGVQATRDPVITNYFQQKEALDEVRSERTALERMVADANGGPLNTQAFLLLPTILNNTPQLRAAIEELSSRQAALRTEQQFLTDANPRIKQLAEAVHVLNYQTIPQITRSVLESLRQRESALGARIDTQSAELRGIPPRTIEEMRLVRQVSASENLYNTLKARYEEVSLAEAQTSPDLSVLDAAVAPMRPSSNDAPRFLLLAILASLGLACGIALLRDRFDRIFRYPQQATHELGLTIAGTVPRLKANRRGDFQLAMMSQAVESFRTLRLAVRYDFPGNSPIALAVSSSGGGEGKSLVSSNLALAFASAGNRTLLIDGDVRCGTQHTTFDLPIGPGLVDYLRGVASMEGVIRRTASENLFLLPCGTRRNRAPELIVSDRMHELVLSAREQFDVVIVDSAPFVAGVDAYALGAVTGSLLVVMRPGFTDRKLTAAKLEILDRLPIRILGAVLNDVPGGGAYRYYATDYAYGGERGSRPPIGSLATPTGLVLQA